jgi:hypothetical protein
MSSQFTIVNKQKINGFAQVVKPTRPVGTLNCAGITGHPPVPVWFPASFPWTQARADPIGAQPANLRRKQSWLSGL